jgi:hypothetical protein
MDPVSGQAVMLAHVVEVVPAGDTSVVSVPTSVATR